MNLHSVAKDIGNATVRSLIYQQLSQQSGGSLRKH
ncbi:MAG: hypothetical protein ACI9PN_002422 [Candidatus Azotimanducaceae bacterium]